MTPPSLQRKLSITLGATILLAALLAGVVSFLLAYAEAKEFQDDMLRQIAVLAGAPGKSTALAASKGLSDAESRVTVIRLPGDPLPTWMTQSLAPGLHTVKSGSDELRIYIRDTAQGERIVVAQPTDTRDELAGNSALRSVVPLVLLLPLVAWLIIRNVRRVLTPVARLATILDAQRPDQLEPLTDRETPTEISPFVHAINRLLQRVNLLTHQQRRFIADAAHELRSPLTALSLQAQNLRQAKTPAEMHERILPLLDGIKRAQTLTEQLLNLARMQATTEKNKTVDLSALARELIAEYLPEAEAKQIDLGLNEVALLQLQATPDTLRLIVKNALDNAIKYAPSGSAVTLQLRKEANIAIIEVIDSGPGIPAEEREPVFAPFYRLPGNAASGSGLGLSIAREAAHLLGGEISLHIPPSGKGLLFRYSQTQLTTGSANGN